MAETSTRQYSNRETFKAILNIDMAIHPVLHDNGNQVVMSIDGGTLTMARQTMEEEVAYSN